MQLIQFLVLSIVLGASLVLPYLALLCGLLCLIVKFPLPHHLPDSVVTAPMASMPPKKRKFQDFEECIICTSCGRELSLCICSYKRSDEPETSGTRPCKLSDEPETSGKRPCKLSDEPETSGTRPCKLSDEPETNGTRPCKLSDEPETSGSRPPDACCSRKSDDSSMGLERPENTDINANGLDRHPVPTPESPDLYYPEEISELAEIVSPELIINPDMVPYSFLPQFQSQKEPRKSILKKRPSSEISGNSSGPDSPDSDEISPKKNVRFRFPGGLYEKCSIGLPNTLDIFFPRQPLPALQSNVSQPHCMGNRFPNPLGYDKVNNGIERIQEAMITRSSQNAQEWFFNMVTACSLTSPMNEINEARVVDLYEFSGDCENCSDAEVDEDSVLNLDEAELVTGDFQGSEENDGEEGSNGDENSAAEMENAPQEKDVLEGEDAPQGNGFAVVPEKNDAVEVDDVPERYDAAEVEDVPGRYDATEVDDVPERYDAAEVEDVPGRYDATEVDDVPERYDAAEVEDIPERYDAVEVDDVPGRYDATEVDDVPGRYDATEVDDVPGRYDATEVDDVPERYDATEVDDVPELNSFVEGMNVLELNSYAERKDFPEENDTVEVEDIPKLESFAEVENVQEVKSFAEEDIPELSNLVEEEDIKNEGDDTEEKSRNVEDVAGMDIEDENNAVDINDAPEERDLFEEVLETDDEEDEEINQDLETNDADEEIIRERLDKAIKVKNLLEMIVQSMSELMKECNSYQNISTFSRREVLNSVRDLVEFTHIAQKKGYLNVDENNADTDYLKFMYRNMKTTIEFILTSLCTSKSSDTDSTESTEEQVESDENCNAAEPVLAEKLLPWHTSSNDPGTVALHNMEPEQPLKYETFIGKEMASENLVPGKFEEGECSYKSPFNQKKRNYRRELKYQKKQINKLVRKILKNKERLKLFVERNTITVDDKEVVKAIVLSWVTNKSDVGDCGK